MKPLIDSRLQRVALGFFVAGAMPATAGMAAISVVEPRAFGYTIGDIVERELIVVTPDPLGLAVESLPKAGRINAGLELREIGIEHRRQAGATRHDLRLRYQIFAAPRQVTAVVLPAVTLKLSGAAAEVAHVGEWPVFVAPLVGESFAPASGLAAMRPDAAPPAINTVGMRLRLDLFGLATALLGVALAYRRIAAWLPGRRAAPFAAAYRDLRRLRRDASAEAFRRGLKRLHRAFDETAGGAVFAESSERFFAAHPIYLAARQPILAFFARSQHEFFAAAGTPDAADMAGLLDLCRQCRRLESGDA